MSFHIQLEIITHYYTFVDFYHTQKQIIPYLSGNLHSIAGINLNPEISELAKLKGLLVIGIDF